MVAPHYVNNQCTTIHHHLSLSSSCGFHLFDLFSGIVQLLLQSGNPAMQKKTYFTDTSLLNTILVTHQLTENIVSWPFSRKTGLFSSHFLVLKQEVFTSRTSFLSPKQQCQSTRMTVFLSMDSMLPPVKRY